MSYEFDDDGADYRYLRNVIRSLEEEVDTIPSVAGGSAPQALISRATSSVTSATPPVTSGEGEPSNWKASVHATTTGNITLSGIQTVDNVALKKGNRILVKNQTDGTTNGIYIVDSGEWERSADTDSAQELENFATFVRDGEVHGEQSYLCTNSSITRGTTNITIIQFASNYNDQSVEAWIRNATTDFWEGINNLQSTVQGWVETIVSGLEDAAAAVTLWYGTYIADPWGRGDDTLDSIARVVFGEVEEDGTEIDDPATFNYDDNETRARTLFEWIDNIKTDAWNVATWIWEQAKAAPDPVGPLLTWLEDTVTDVVQDAIEWANSTLYAPYSRRDTTEPWDGFLDGIQRIIFGEVKTRNGSDVLSGGKRVDIRSDPDYMATGANSRGRDFFEWWEDILVPTSTGFFDWIWGEVKKVPIVGDFLDAVEEAWEGAIKWTSTNIVAPYARRDATKPLDGFLDGIQRIIFGEVDDDGDPVDRDTFDFENNSTRARNFFEWWHQVLSPTVKQFGDWIWGGLTSAPDPIGPFFVWLGTVAEDTLENLTKWTSRYLFGPYSRRTIGDDDPLDGFFDGLSRILFGEVKTSDSTSFDPDDTTDMFSPTSTNTRSRTFFEWWDVAVKPSFDDFKNWIINGVNGIWELFGIDWPEWDDETQQWWDTSLDAAWKNLNSNVKGGLNFLRQMFFGELIPSAYAEGAADKQVNSAFHEFGEELGIAADDLGTSIAEAFAGIHQWFEDTFGGGDDGGLTNLQLLTQKITWKKGTEKTPGATELGIGVSAVNTMYFNVPDGQDVHFREGGSDVLIIKPTEVKFYQHPAPDSDKGKDLGSDGTRWNTAYVDDVNVDDRIKLQSHSADISESSLSNGEIWLRGNDVKVRTGGKTLGIGGLSNLQRLTQKITWNQSHDTATIPSNSEVGFGISLTDQLYIKAASSKFIRFQIGGVNRLNIAGYVGVWGTLRSENNGTNDLGTSSNRWHIVHTEGVQLGGTEPTVKNNGLFWVNGGNAKVRSGGNTVDLGLKNLTIPIRWSIAAAGKSGGNENENNIGFDNSNDFYVKMKGSKMIIKSGNDDLFEVKNDTVLNRVTTKGAIKIYKDMIPSANEAESLGKADLRWNKIYAKSITLYGTPALSAGSTDQSIGTSERPFGVGNFGNIFSTNNIITKVYHVNGTFDADDMPSDPSGTISNGMIWRKGDDVIVQTGGSRVDLSNISGGTGSLQNLTKKITWNLTAGTAKPNSTEVGLGADNKKNMLFNVPTDISVSPNVPRNYSFCVNGNERAKLTDNRLTLSTPIVWVGAGPLGTSKTIKDLAQNTSGITLNSVDNMIFRVANNKSYAFTGNNYTFMTMYPGRIQLGTNSTDSTAQGSIWRSGNTIKARVRRTVSGTVVSATRDFFDIGKASDLTGVPTKITFDTTTTVGKVPTSTEIGLGYDSTDLYLSAPTSVHARIAGTNVCRFLASAFRPEGKGTTDLGQALHRWKVVHTTALQLGGTAPTTKGNGTMWFDGTNIKFKTGGTDKTLGSGGGSVSFANVASDIYPDKTSSNRYLGRVNNSWGWVLTENFRAYTNGSVLKTLTVGHTETETFDGRQYTVNSGAVNIYGTLYASTSISTPFNSKLGFFGSTADTKYSTRIFGLGSAPTLSQISDRINKLIAALDKYGLIN